MLFHCCFFVFYMKELNEIFEIWMTLFFIVYKEFLPFVDRIYYSLIRDEGEDFV